MMNLADLEVFVQAASLGGLTRASERLGISKSIVSRRLAKLEAELGIRLLTRTTRGISLTEAGSELLVRAQRILAEEADARAALAGQEGELAGRLRLAASVSFGISHLAPVLADFAVLHPRLELDVSYGDRLHDIVGEGFDAALRIGKLENSALVARRITLLDVVLVAAPSYLQRRDVPRSPQDLSHHDALIYTGSRDPSVWQFSTGSGRVGVRVQGRIRSDSGDGLRAAAIAGLGIGLFPRFMVSTQIESRQLMLVLDKHPLPQLGLYLVRPQGTASMKVKLFSDYLVERFGNANSWDPPTEL
jgi:DNA-binding transcriptional LysR family regulator